MPQEKALDQLLEPVQVRNATRTSLNIRVPGLSLHLPPRATVEVPRAYLETDELKTLRQQGAVLLVETVAAPRPAVAAPENVPEALGAAASESKGTRAHKR